MRPGPPGWPREVDPPDAPGWRRGAVAWLLDQCPSEYRGYEVLLRHPPALAVLAAHHVAGAREATAQALGGIRADLADAVPPEVVPDVIEALERESARLLAAGRGVQLIADALRGRRYIPRL